jgi:hypothetical protein
MADAKKKKSGTIGNLDDETTEIAKTIVDRHCGVVTETFGSGVNKYLSYEVALDRCKALRNALREGLSPRQYLVVFHGTPDADFHSAIAEFGKGTRVLWVDDSCCTRKTYYCSVLSFNSAAFKHFIASRFVVKKN